MLVQILLIFMLSMYAANCIRKGNNAKENQFPYQALINYSSLGSICGGVLIHKKFVLTAAHCKLPSKPDKNYKVVLGCYRLTDGGQVINIINFIPHPKFNKFSGTISPHDIALVEMAKSIKQSPAVKPITLGNLEDCDSLGEAIVSGWGARKPYNLKVPNILQHATVSRISNKDCTKQLINVIGDFKPLDDTMICTKSKLNNNQSTCFGDDGGPLVLVANYRLVGIISWYIPPCGLYDAPSVYTSICAHSDFIKQHVHF
ncbi:hypothetical protein ILUMI_24646 [Ignelater luminosus]|uniref:Peptidase S1 domain-containing protein n=1 Tax=Ignelater luminosus TaxID=2038154 RepID=A0A8K0C6Q9_IGNLU|nr:hypothetical protein ILUMI_24646 [Ignelater luminosus]